MSIEENNPLDFSSNNPITEAAGLEAVLGMINPKEVGQVENDSVTEDEIEEETVEVASEDELEETPDQDVEEELDEGDVTDGDIELEDGEYDYILAVREVLQENGLDDVEKVKSGLLMQGDYTRKTQALSEERKAFEAERDTQLQELAKVLEIQQAQLYGEKPQYTTQELIALKQTDPYAYEQALEAKVLYEAKQQELNEVSSKVAEQYQAQQQEQQQAYAQEQMTLLTQMEPSFADQNTAVENVEVMSEYFKSIGGDPEMLNTVNDALVLKVLYDAAKASKSQKEVASAKAPKKKKASKTVLRKGTSSSKAEKQAAAQRAKMQKATRADGSYSKEAAVDLILDAFK
jgi:hypothetical protein